MKFYAGQCLTPKTTHKNIKAFTAFWPKQNDDVSAILKTKGVESVCIVYGGDEDGK